jgi:hypothetical protein
MGRHQYILALSAALFISLSQAALSQTNPPRFSGSDLPPPELEKPPPPSLYDTFAVGDTSPLGTKVSSIRPDELIKQAVAFLPGANGRQANPAEAAFWLKQVVATAPVAAPERSWALMRLGLLVYSGSGPNAQTGEALARELWELAGAWNQPEALCNLGELAEHGDDYEGADRAKAIVWYTRAKKAGCAQADDALARLKP